MVTGNLGAWAQPHIPLVIKIFTLSHSRCRPQSMRTPINRGAEHAGQVLY